MKYYAKIGLIGDIGNPSGTGKTSIQLNGLPSMESTSAFAKLDDFFTALAPLLLAAKAEKAFAVDDEVYAVKPGTSCNVDRKMVVSWRQRNDSSVHRLTIPGIKRLESTEWLVGKDSGERLSEPGKAALKTALDALYGFTADTDDAIVLDGFVIQPK